MAAAAEIPIINLTHPDQAQVAHDLVSAATEHGFVYIKNTGSEIPVSSIDAAFDLSRKLFAAPLEEKQAYTIQTNNRGWSGMHSETLDPKTQKIGDYKEAFNFGPFPDGKAAQPLPPTIQPYESQIADFRSKCYDLCLKLVTLFGIGLEVNPPTFFTTAHNPSLSSGTTLRHLYYPPVSDSSPSDDIRAGAHSDYGSITLLFRLAGQAGLEIQTQAGDWVPVPVVPPSTENDPAPPILVNIGDVLSYWTGGLLRSTVHRVVFPSASSRGSDLVDNEARYSIAFFGHPAGDTQLGPVPSERVKKHVASKEAGELKDLGQVKNPYAERKAITADEHLQMRLRASFLGLYDKEDEVSRE